MIKKARGKNEAFQWPPKNELIGGKKPKSSIFIALKKDTSYNVTPMDKGLLISFPKTFATTTPISMTNAIQLQSISVTELKNNADVNKTADRAIKDIKSFTTDNPPRIIFDMYNIESPYENEQKTEVGSKWLRQGRHNPHPDKVRLVLDTYQDFLSNFSASSTHNGLHTQLCIIPGSQPE